MEGSSSPPSDSNQTASGASEFLRNLPSRGLLSSTVFSSNPGGMRVYICCHDTAPPEGQQIQTNQQNILIRSLTLKKPKRESNSKDVKVASAAEGSAPEGSRKRAAERVLDSRASAKRAVGQTSSRQEGSSSQASSRDFQGLTVERLRALLKAKGLSLKGKKDELVARLKSSSS